LATVHSIIEQHRGWVDVQTEYGRGTQFRVCLPEAQRPAQTDSEAGEHPVLRGSETILLVEDEAGVRAIVRATLERSGYRVFEAAGPEGAKEIWRTRARGIDLLVTDLVMPGRVSGEQLANQLRADRPELPVLFISGYGGHGLSLAPGMRLLQKPFP